MIYFVLDDLNSFLSEAKLDLEEYGWDSYPFFLETGRYERLLRGNLSRGAGARKLKSKKINFINVASKCLPQDAARFAHTILDLHKHGFDVIVQEVSLPFIWELNRLQEAAGLADDEICLWNNYSEGFIRRSPDGYFHLPMLRDWGSIYGEFR